MGCSNLMLHGVNHDCTTNVAGVSKIYFTYRDNITPVVDYNTNTMTSYSLVGKWYEYDFAKNSASLSSTLGFTDNGIPFYTHTINMSLNGLSAEKNLEVMALADNELVALIVDANGKAWYVGVDGYINSSSSEFATGADVNNRYGYALTIDGSSEYLPFEYLGALPDDPSFDPRPYLTFNVTGAGNIHNGLHTFGAAAEYRINYGEWVNDLEEIPVVAGDIVQFRAQVVNPFGAFTGCSAEYYLTGYLSSIINGWSDFENLNTYTQGSAFSYLFAKCSGLTDASQLFLIKEIGAGGYSGMFRDCKKLTKAPEILGENAPDSCYKEMFFGCSSLITGPSRIATSATTLGYNCCQGMFNGCSSLTDAPDLPATDLNEYCYDTMFLNCTNLVNGPVVIGSSATTMPYRACSNMFQGCTNLSAVPDLPCREVSERCYYAMFRNCTSILTAPNLPATNLSGCPYCYSYMFYGCSSLINIPSILPATALSNSCYAYMFDRCSNLSQVCELPATILEPYCYQFMFAYTNIYVAPILPATDLVQFCYKSMFQDCGNLQNVTCLATGNPTSVNNATSSWLENVAANGYFTTPASTDWSTPFPSNGIPTGWTRHDA